MTIIIIYFGGVTVFAFLGALGWVSDLIRKREIPNGAYWKMGLVMMIWPLVMLLILLVLVFERDNEAFRLVREALKELYDTARGRI